MGASGGAFRTTVEFDGNEKVDVEQATANAIIGYQQSPRLGFVASVGAILTGSVEHVSKEDVAAGIVASATVTYLPVFETSSRPFVLGSFTLGHSRTKAGSDDGTKPSWTASDARLGIMVGKTFDIGLVPFATARVFGGPVNWRLGGQDVTGSDVHHYAVGAGTSYRIPGKLDVFAEILPFGEQSASFGVSLPL